MNSFECQALRVRFPGAATEAVRGIDLRLSPGETLGLVGESGSGKSTVALAVLGLLPRGSQVRADRLTACGSDLRGLTNTGWRRLRGRRIGIVFQDPLAALTPTLTVGQQLDEPLRLHLGLDRRAARRRTIALLEQVGIDEAARRADEHPHRFSGGQRQRICLAMALACDPELLIADEPTTALDVLVQAQILDLLRAEQQRRGMTLLLISHDLGVVAGCCARVAVMADGRIVEEAPAAQLFAAPAHPYTRGLIGALPRLDGPRDRPLAQVAAGDRRLARVGTSGLPWRALPAPANLPQLPRPSASHRLRCEWLAQSALITPPAAIAAEDHHRAPLGEALLAVRDLQLRYANGVQALAGVDLDLAAGEALGLVGASGSGKSSLARAILQLHPPCSGSVRLAGHELCGLRGAALRRALGTIGMVFQDPAAALDPRWPAWRLVAEALLLRGISATAARAQALAMLIRVDLDPAWAERYPHQFSGGQRQRLVIARALIHGPRLLICDEPVSSLDVSVQAQILELLIQLRRELGLAMLFIGHDLAVVRRVCDRVAVMESGCIVEQGGVDALYAAPAHPYTRALLAAVPGPVC